MTGPLHGERVASHVGPVAASRPRAFHRWSTVALLAVLVAVLAGRPTDAAPARTVGVVEFYALSPTPSFGGIVPEEYAAADASRLLPALAGNKAEVISRDTVRQAEVALGWRPWDVLSFSRLAQLAGRIGADELVVGWIRMLHLDTEGPGIGRLGFGQLLSGSATVLLQIFDVRQGRVVAEAPGDGYTIGQVRAFVAEQVLHLATAQALPRVFAKLTPEP
jgi:hypothetical protein